MYAGHTLVLFILFPIVLIHVDAQSADWKLRSLCMSGAKLRMVETRNMYQCERFCQRFKQCVSVSYSTKSRVCSLYHKEFTEGNITPSKEGIVSTGINVQPDVCRTSGCHMDSVCASTGNKSVCLPAVAADCQEFLEAEGAVPDGLYTIRPEGAEFLEVYCDMTDDGGGWTVLQRRMDGSENFFRTWQDYQKGFGNLRKEFWLGNDNIYHLTNQKNYQLKIVMEDFEDNRVYASYSVFRIGDSRALYRLTIDGYRGNGGDSLIFHDNMAFSTKDADNDIADDHCAQEYLGGWWYRACLEADLNGEYNNTGYAKGVNWKAFRGINYSLKYVEMKIRP